MVRMQELAANRPGLLTPRRLLALALAVVFVFGVAKTTTTVPALRTAEIRKEAVVALPTAAHRTTRNRLPATGEDAQPPPEELLLMEQGIAPEAAPVVIGRSRISNTSRGELDITLISQASFQFSEYALRLAELWTGPVVVALWAAGAPASLRAELEHQTKVGYGKELMVRQV